MEAIQELEVKKVGIGYEKTCNCPPNHINCLTAKEWLKSQVAIQEFSYNGRDVRDKDIHPAVFPISLLHIHRDSFDPNL